MLSGRCSVYSRLASLVIPTILAMVVGVSAANAQSTVGTVTQVQGAVSILRGGSSVAVVPNLPVQLHDKIVTQPGASLTVGLIDNSSLQLGPSTTLTIDESEAINGVGAPSKMTLLGGSLHTVIVGAMKGHPYEIRTPNAISTAHGTEWDLSYTEGTTRDGYQDCKQFTDVKVQDGTVKVANAQTGMGTQEVPAGHLATVGCGIDPVDPPFVDHSVEYIAGGVLGVGGVTLGILCATQTWDWCAGSTEHGGETAPVSPHR
jgi:ferric-dicitrate binding protein FerR (iron transport regulator)